jgi:hypothetical protein
VEEGEAVQSNQLLFVIQRGISTLVILWVRFSLFLLLILFMINIYSYILQEEDMYNKDFVFFPMFVGGNHWTLVVLESRAKSIKLTFYDPMGLMNGKKEMKVFIIFLC